MRRRLLALLTLVALLVPAPVALAQTTSPNPFTPPTQVVPTETATPAPTPKPASTTQDTDRRLLFAIGAGLIVLFVVIGRVITRDARRSLPESEREQMARLREQGPHRHSRQAKAKARAKTKAQRAARRQNR